MSNPIPEGWEQNKLGKYIGIQGGNAFKSEAFAEKGVPVVRISNIKKDGSVNLDGSIFVSQDESLNRFKVQFGDTLIAMSGATTGKVGRYYLNSFSYLNQRVGRFFVKNDKISMDYIHQITAKDSFVLSILIDAIGGAQPNISNLQIESITALFPPLPEQQKIAAILTSVDEVIEKTQAQIDKLKDLKTAMMQELLTNGVGTKQASTDAALNNRTACRESYIPHTEFKDSPVGRIPKSWEVKPLSEYVSFLSYGFTNPMPESEAGPYMITAKDVYGLKIQYSKARKTTKAAYDDLLTRKSRPQVNDILLTKDGTLGRVALVEYENCCINQSVAVMTPNEKILPKFLLYLLASPSYQVEMLDKAGGSTIKHIYITIVDKMMLSVPCLSEQGRVVRIIDGLLNKIDLAEKKLLKIKNTKKALMQDLLTGKVRVKVDQ